MHSYHNHGVNEFAGRTGKNESTKTKNGYEGNNRWGNSKNTWARGDDGREPRRPNNRYQENRESDRPNYDYAGSGARDSGRRKNGYVGDQGRQNQNTRQPGWAGVKNNTVPSKGNPKSDLKQQVESFYGNWKAALANMGELPEGVDILGSSSSTPNNSGGRSTNDVLSTIYQDIHAASGSLLDHERAARKMAKDISPEFLQLHQPEFPSLAWIQANVERENLAAYRVIEYALACYVYPEQDISVDILRQCKRFGGFANEHGWMLLSILAWSGQFRKAGRNFEDRSWTKLCMKIAMNAISLELFAKIRGLNWTTALERQTQYVTNMASGAKEMQPNFIDGHPHSYIVPEKFQQLRQPQFEGQSQVPIRQNIYIGILFEYTQVKPSNWPVGKRYPSDPTLRGDRDEGFCALCGKSNCSCDTQNSLHVTHPLIELRTYGDKGTGIRALEKIWAGAILDEYVGEIVPVNLDVDAVYGLGFSHPRSSDSMPIAVISSKIHGNWTRFLNHSCSASTMFEVMIIGTRYRVMVRAVRDIEVFEEITVDYGPEYWTHRRQCLCSTNCRYSANSEEEQLYSVPMDGLLYPGDRDWGDSYSCPVPAGSTNNGEPMDIVS